jgi:hypothetical protein
MCGFVAGSKLTGGGYILIMGLFLILDAWRDLTTEWRSLLKHLIILGGLCLLVVGPWYARSYVFTGNPVWPFLYGVFGGKNWDWLGDEYHMESMNRVWTEDLPLSLEGLWTSLRLLFLEPARLGGYHGGLGQVMLVLVGFSVFVLRKAPDLVHKLLLTVALYFALWFLLVSRQVRFLFPIMPALSLLGAFAFYALWDRLRLPILRWFMAGLLAFFLGRHSPWIQSGTRESAKNRLLYVMGERSQEGFLQSEIDAMPAFNYINSYLSSDAMVLLLPYETRGYYLERQYIWGHPISQRIIRFEEYDNPEELAQDLRHLGVTHILDNPHWLYTELRHWEHDRDLMLELEKQCGEQIAAWNDVILYRLENCDG